MKIEKLYFTLGEVCERWRMPEGDVAYLAENGDLRVSVRVCRLPIEISSIEETADGERFSLPHTHTRFSGVLDLHADDAFRVFRKRVGRPVALPRRRWRLRQHPPGLRGCRGSPATTCSSASRSATDTRRAVGFIASAGDPPTAPSVIAPPPASSPSSGVGRLSGSADRREVLQLGPIQAEVVRALHAAQLAGDYRGRAGRRSLPRQGRRACAWPTSSNRKPGWRRLIQSNHRGSYRLAAAIWTAAISSHTAWDGRGIGAGWVWDERGCSAKLSPISSKDQ